jgi:hypothetical protein
MKKLTLLVLSITTVFAVQANAGGKRYVKAWTQVAKARQKISELKRRAFATKMEFLRSKCDLKGYACDYPYLQAVFELDMAKKFTEYKRAQQMTYDLTDDWLDTIYEGDYVNNGEFFVKRIAQLMKKNEDGTIVVLGYYMTYGDPAIWVGGRSCLWNDRTQKYSNCPEGEILESSFISPDWRFVHQSKGDEEIFYPELLQP